MRDSVSDIIPTSLLNAPKRGFGFGITEKNLLQGPWKQNAERVLNDFPEHTAIDPAKVKNIWETTKNDKFINWDIIMKLVNLGTYLEENQFS